MTGRPGHWSEPGEYNIWFLGSIRVISSQDSSALEYREFTQEGAMTISPFAAKEGTSAPQWPNVKKCCLHLVPSSDFFVQSYAVPNNVRAACLQNETAPKSFNFKTKNGPKNDPKLPRKFLSLVLLCRISHRHYFKIFHREFPRKIKYFFTTRICRHGHASIMTVFKFFFSGFWLVFDSSSSFVRAFFDPGAERPREPLRRRFSEFSRERPFLPLAEGQ